jgi:hypothetical protein
MFSDEQADALVAGWKIIAKEKQVSYLREAATEQSLDEWMDLYAEVGDPYSREQWLAKYETRINAFQYAHLYFYLKKGIS